MSDTPHRWIRARHRHDRRRLLTEHEGAVLPVLASLDAHRRLRGPYTAGGTLLRMVVPAALRRWPDLVAAHEVEILALAPELAPVVPATREAPAEPDAWVRCHSRLHTRRLAHGVAEFVHELLRRLDDGPRCLLVDNAHEADPTDLELFAVLLRRADPALLRLRVATASDAFDDPEGPLAEPLGPVLDRYTVAVSGKPTPPPPLPPGDLVRWYLADHCTDDDPRLRDAYEELDAWERAALHDARAAALEAVDEPTLRLGAIPFHREHGADPGGAGARALRTAQEACLARGFHHAAVELGRRGHAVVPEPGAAAEPEGTEAGGAEAGGTDTGGGSWWAFTSGLITALVALDRPEECTALLEEARSRTADPVTHMEAAHAYTALLTRRPAPVPADHVAARAWANTVLAHAVRLPDPAARTLQAVLGHHELAAVAMREGRPQEALRLVGEGIGLLESLEPGGGGAAVRVNGRVSGTGRVNGAGKAGRYGAGRSRRGRGPDDGEYAPHHRLLRHHRALVHLALGRHREALADLDEVIAAMPHHPEYHFDRGNVLRRMGRPAEAVAAYERAMELSPPFAEAVYNRADARLELGDDEGALADFGHVLELDPACVNAYVNRAGLRFRAGDTEGAWQDVRAGLALAADDPHLLCLRGQLLAESYPRASFAALTDLVTHHPDYAPGWAARAALAYERGDVAAAIGDLDHSLSLEDDPVARFNRAVAYLGARRHREALADFTVVFQATGDPQAQLHIGACLLALGRRPQAAEAFRACTEADPALAPRVNEYRRHLAVR